MGGTCAMLMGCAIGGCCGCWNGLRTPETGWLSISRFGGSLELLPLGLKAFGRIGCGFGGCSADCGLGGCGCAAIAGAGGGVGGCGAAGCDAGGAGLAGATGGGATGGAIGAVGALYVPEVVAVPNVAEGGVGGGVNEGVAGGAAGVCGVDGIGGGAANDGVGGGADGIGGGADGVTGEADGIGGGAEDNGEEYVKPLGFGSGVDSGMADDGNCGGCASCEGCAVGATGVPQPRQTLSLAARIRPHFLQIGIFISG